MAEMTPERLSELRQRYYRAEPGIQELLAWGEALEAERDDLRSVVATLKQVNREALGVPASEHQIRRLEDMAQRLEAAEAERDALRAAMDEAVQERDRLRSQVERVEALGREPYRLADAICHEAHPDVRAQMTGFLVPGVGFVSSCASCKSIARDALRRALDGE